MFSLDPNGDPAHRYTVEQLAMHLVSRTAITLDFIVTGPKATKGIEGFIESLSAPRPHELASRRLQALTPGEPLRLVWLRISSWRDPNTQVIGLIDTRTWTGDLQVRPARGNKELRPPNHTAVAL